MKYKLIDTDDGSVISSHNKPIVAMKALVRQRKIVAKYFGPKAYCAIRIYCNGKQISACEYLKLSDELKRINFNCRPE
jgi:hypothetical protein